MRTAPNDEQAARAAADRGAPRGRKAAQILAGARECFMARGFEAASVDEIARTATVSKATLYAYYPDKQALFAAVVADACAQQAAVLDAVPDGASESSADVALALRDTARRLIRFMTGPFAQAIFRMVVAESARFPELGRTFFESGPARGAARLARFLEEADRAGTLRVPDPALSAHQFVELCRARCFYTTLFGIADPPDEDSVARHADAAVAVFLDGVRRR